jgi:hypothetical protein
MNAQRWPMTIAGTFIVLSLTLAHFTGQIDMSNVSWL